MELQFNILNMLSDLNQEQNYFYDEGLANDFEAEICGMGLTWESTLTDVMLKGNSFTVDKDTDEQSNFFDIYKANLNQKLSGSNFKSLTKQSFVNSTKHRYNEMILSGENTIRPLREWSRNAIAYFSIQHGFDLSLDDLCFFVLFPDFQCPPLVDSFAIGNALHELSQGVADSLLIDWLSKPESKDYDILEAFEEFKLSVEQSVIKENDTSLSQKEMVAWLHELGIINIIAQKCKEGGTYNFSKMGAIIQSFAKGVTGNSIRQSLTTLLLDQVDSKNYPLNDKNGSIISKMKSDLKIA